MSDPVAPAADAATDQAPPVDQAPAAPEKTFTQSDVDALIAKRLGRFKDYDDLKAKAAKLAEIEAASASDVDKAVAKAKAETRAAVAREIGEKAARGVVAAHLTAAGRKADEAAALLDTLNLAKFVTDEGEIDTEAIAKATALLAPARAAVDLGQGARGNAPTLDQQLAEARQKGDVVAEMNILNHQLLAKMQANAAP